MKIRYQDDQLLQLRPRGGWAMIIIGIVMALSALLWVWLLGQNTTLSCERVSADRPQCELSHDILGYTVSHTTLDMLMGAHVARTTDSDGDNMYRLMLKTGDQEIPFTRHTSSNSSQSTSAAADIQHYLTNTSIQSLEIQAAGTAGLIVGGISILIGAGLSLGGAQSLSTLWTFDRNQDALVKYRKGLFGPKVWQYTLSDITDVIVGSSRSSDGDRTYRVELYTTQGQKIPMTSWYSSGYRRKQQSADIIRAFINLS